MTKAEPQTTFTWVPILAHKRVARAKKTSRATLLVAPNVAAAVPQIRIYRDSGGGAWRLTYVPISSNEMSQLQSLYEQGRLELEELPLPEEDERSVEMKWLQENQDQLAALAGQWIAIDGPKLVAHAFELSTLLEQAERAGSPHPFVTAIPGEPVRDFFGLLRPFGTAGCLRTGS
jgi:hypothetical protein